MFVSEVDAINATFHKTHEWLRQLREIGGFATESQAYTALRAVLHVLRDRLTVDEAAQLAAQMPMLIRGLYFEGWKPARVPVRYRALDDFLGAVSRQMGNADVTPERACRAVFSLLTSRISSGEVEDVYHMMPAEVRGLWPARS